MRRQSGFMLIEMMIVLLIIGILAIVSMILAACGGNGAVINQPNDSDGGNSSQSGNGNGNGNGGEMDEDPTAEPTEEMIPETTRVGGWLDTVAMSVVSSDSATTQIEAGAIDLYAGTLSTPRWPPYIKEVHGPASIENRRGALRAKAGRSENKKVRPGQYS